MIVYKQQRRTEIVLDDDDDDDSAAHTAVVTQLPEQKAGSEARVMAKEEHKADDGSAMFDEVFEAGEERG